MNGQTQLVFYSEHARELVGSTENKIKAILAQGCIEWDSEKKCFICKPIMQKNGKPYNKTTHIIKNHKAFGFSCSCQWWQMKLKKHESDPINNPAPGCSHICALYEFLKRRNMNIRQEKIYGGMQTTFGVE